MKPNTLSVAMDTALRAWRVKPASDDTQDRQIHVHALAHGVSVSGLRLALQRAGLIAPRKPRKAA